MSADLPPVGSRVRVHPSPWIGESVLRPPFTGVVTEVDEERGICWVDAPGIEPVRDLPMLDPGYWVSADEIEEVLPDDR